MSEMNEVAIAIAEHLDTMTFPSDAVRNCARALEIEATIDESAGMATVLQIMDAILTADDIDAVFAAANAGTLSSKTHVGIPFYLTAEDIEWKASGAAFRKAGSWPFYALCRITDMATGERQVLTGGGATFCAVLFRLQKIGAFNDVEFTEFGMPMVIIEKPASIGSVIIPQKYTLPKTNRAAKK